MSQVMPPIDPSEIETVSTSAPRTATPDELAQRIKNAGGVLTAQPYSSEWLIAVNSPLKFKAERQPDGSFKIYERPVETYVALAGLVLLVILLTR